MRVKPTQLLLPDVVKVVSVLDREMSERERARARGSGRRGSARITIYGGRLKQWYHEVLRAGGGLNNMA